MINVHLYAGLIYKLKYEKSIKSLNSDETDQV